MANRDEVEEFLRRAAARRAAAQQQQQQQQQQRPVTPQWTPPPAQQQRPQFPQQQFPQQPYPQQGYPQQAAPQQPLAQRRPASLAEVVILEPVDTVDAELVEVELADQGDRVGRSVAQHMRGTEDIAEHTRHLGEEVDAADNKMAAHLHQVFDHKVGDLKKSTMEAAAASPSQAARDAPLPGAASIARMLADPQSLRNAFIMAEILKRPDAEV
jgi:hypothetical protein